MTLCSI